MTTTITIAEALALGRDLLPLSASPALDARLLLEHVLEKDRGKLKDADEKLVVLQDSLVKIQTLK